MSQNPPGRIPQNRLTRGMDLVEQYNTMYPPRVAGGMGVPQEQFQSSPQGQQGPALSPQEAADREARWLAETGQMLDERGNVVPIPRPTYAPPQGPAFAANPGVIRRAPEPIYGPSHPGMVSAPYPYYPAPDRPMTREYMRTPTPQSQPQPAPFQSFTSVQSIQSIDLERGIVWADGQSFPFDLRSARQVVEFALGVISSAFAAQLGNLLQRYGLTVVPSSGDEGLRAVRSEPLSGSVSPGPEGQEGPEAQVQGVSSGGEQAGEDKAQGDSSATP